LNINFEPLTFCCVLFVLSILIALNVININMCRLSVRPSVTRRYWVETSEQRVGHAVSPAVAQGA